MSINYKKIHIGELIKSRVKELNIPIERIIKFMSLEINEIEQMYTLETLDSGIILKWSKLLEYDFFRIYTQHLILYSPSNNNVINLENNTLSQLPVFRKNIYTKEVVDFMIELIDTNQKTIAEIIAEYKIPKTTIYKWISKYKK